MMRPLATLAMRDSQLRDALITPPLAERLLTLLECDLDVVVSDFNDPTLDLSRTEVLLTGWGCPRVDKAALDRMPSVALIAHLAGTVKGHLDPVCWERGILVTTAASANAVPVAEFTLAQILLANKAASKAARHYAHHRDSSWGAVAPVVGNYGRTVGIIGASSIGRLVLERLSPFDLRPLLYDPTLSDDEIRTLGAVPVALDELMAEADVVSLHAPILPQTVGMIGGPQLSLMRDGATFINTARGVLVDHAALRVELMSGRINAVLDVTDPEPLPADDPLYDLPNVILTPHIAGSMGTELWRMTSLVLDEVERFVNQAPLAHEVPLSDLTRMA